MATVTVSVEKILAADGQELVAKLPFEAGLKLLEQLVATVEGGSLPLEQAIVAYERGATLVVHLRGLLTGAEEKLRILQRPLQVPDSSE